MLQNNIVSVNTRMVKALEEVKAACKEQGVICKGCPCYEDGNCFFTDGFNDVPQEWKLEKTYKEVITDIKF